VPTMCRSASLADGAEARPDHSSTGRRRLMADFRRRERAAQRQTVTHVQIFLKFSQWHCCS
jgi:hypothetical protein